jgi:poly(3-hydroxybutyrate) depolymerase
VGTPGCGNPPAAGKTAETLWVDGVERSFTVAVPAGLDGLSPVPLIFGFHGFGGTGEAASNYFGLTGDEAAIYVYPQALPLPDQGNGVGWNMTEDGVDVAFVDALIDAMTERHCIDLSRVFAAGHSHGASFSNHLGCYRPERFRAIAPVAGGGPWAGPCSVSGDTVAAMLTHGTNDVDVPIAAGISSRDHWREQNGCANALSMHTTPSPCVVYDGCSEPVLWCEHGGGHEWPNFAGEGIRGFFLSF